MSVDRSHEPTISDNGITNGQKKNNEDNVSPESSGRHSRNSRRSRDRSPKHKSRSEKGSSKKKKKDRSVTPKRGRSRSKSADRQRSRHHERSRDTRGSRDERRRDERVNKRDRKSSYSRRDRSRERSPPSSRRKYGRKSRRRRSTSSLSSDDEISNLKQSSTLSGLLMKKDDKKPKSKRRRKASSSSSSSSEDTRDSKPSLINHTAVPETSQQQTYYQAPYMNQQLGFPVQAMPPPSSAVSSYMPHSVLPALPLIPPPLPPTMTQPFYPPPPVPPPSNSIGSIPPPPLPPPAHRQPTLPPVPRAPKPPKYNRPIVLNKTVRDIDNSGDWGSGSVNKYHIDKQVGEGTYGQVYKAEDINGGRFALKKVRLDNEREGFPITAVREIKILRQLNHKNVVQLIDIVTDQNTAADLRTNNANFYLVFEYVDHDLTGLLEAAHNKLIPDFLPNQIAVMFKQLLSGLEYCHSKKFLHRDIKCSNILVNNMGQLKIADWGLARLYHDDHERLYTNRVITLWYRPPELLLGAEHYGPPVDVWSVGCILAEFFTKKAIFMGQHEAEQLLLISSLCGTPTPEVWPDVVNMPLYRTMKPKKMEFRRVKEEFSSIMPSSAIDLLDKMIMLDPKKRLTASEALKHQWIRHIDPAKVPPLQLPCGQDCHELWSKKQKKDRKSGIIPVGTLETKAVPVQPSQSRENVRRHGTENNDGVNAWQEFSALITNTKDSTNFVKVQDLLSTLSEPMCHAIVQELSRQNQGIGLTEMYGSGRNKLLALTSKIFGYPPQVQHAAPQSYTQQSSIGHNLPLNVPPQQSRMHR